MCPSPWADPERLFNAAVHADKVYQRLLPLLADRLNQACGVREPLAYWRLLVGPWLLHFVHALYDRYVHLSDTVSRVDGVRTAVLSEECFRTPNTTGDALRWLTQDDHYNWQLFSELLELMGTNVARSVSTISAVAAPPRPRVREGISRAEGLARLAGERALRLLGGTGRVWLTEITASRSSLLRLAVHSRFRVIPVPVADELSGRVVEPDRESRRGTIGELSDSDDFEMMCSRMLLRHLPTIYLESYGQARRAVQQRYPRLPSVLASETGWYTNETFKYLAAEAVVCGTRLVTIQHGSNYGLARSMQVEAFESTIGDAYFVWGWANGRPSFRNIPHPIVSQLPGRWPGRRTRILFAPNFAERYVHRLGATPGGSLWEPQWQWQGRFVGALPARLRRLVTLRPPRVEVGQAVRERLCDRYPELTVDACVRFKPSVARSRLTILDRLGTGALESLAMNSPTVLFWDPNLWSFRDEASPFVDALRQVGVLWHSPESAAAHVAAVYDDPDAWWHGESVQKARAAFVERFAMSRPDWMRQWKLNLCNELVVATSAPDRPGGMQVRR
jgi:putative transferase (TIGR04331 family)